MFDNIGKKIKILAKVVCWLGITASGITAIRIWGKSNWFQNTFLNGLTVLVLGCLAAWAGSFLMYGFGELLERTVSIDTILRKANGMEDPGEQDPGKPESFLLRMADITTEARENRILKNGGWKCTCGRIHYSHVNSCECGKQRKDVPGAN